MRPEEWHRCVEIFSAALERQPEERAAFVDHACEGDEPLRREVTILLHSHEESGDFISTPAFAVAPELLGDDRDALIGTHIGPYRVESVLGSGGMSVVYLAHDERLGRKVGLKLLPQSFIADTTHLSRLKREARTASALNHPNIVTIHDIGSDHATHYIASELIEGETLRERLVRGPIQLSEAVDIAIQVASALVAAHDAGVVHRDIKPENIMLRPDGYVKVLDFGIAKVAESAFAEPAFAAPKAFGATEDEAESMTLAETNLGSILGTVRYMSPEQARPDGVGIDKRTDIWSLGVVFYEMATGHAPFTGDTPSEVMSSILEKEPAPLTRYVAHTPVELQEIISKTLRKDREERYRSAHELLQALKNFRRKLDAELERAAAPLWLRWIRSPAAVVLALLAAVFALALPFYRHRNLTTTPPPEKSIAVLPLENLSHEKENAFFADGIHDELLSNLSKIKDLKVISRTSVRQYKSGNPRNIREIGQQLGVAHVLEGTVQRTANRVKVSAQLIDARTDTHVWSQTYDRDLVDVFAIQSEIANTIADQLQAKLSPAEKAAIAERPTADLAAYAYYTKAREIDIYGNWQGAENEKAAKQKVELLEKATQRDPNFALAYCALAKAQLDVENFELAKKAAETALRLRPDLAEPHLALARYCWLAPDSIIGEDSDRKAYYDRARDELTIVRGMSPNNAEALLIDATIGRHQNRWDASLANLQRANELDPQNTEVAFRLEQIYFEMRRYSELEEFIRKGAARRRPLGPLEDPFNWLARTKLAQGDPLAAQSLLEQLPPEYSPGWGTLDVRFKTALYLRDYDAVNRVIAATPAGEAPETFGGPLGWAEGLVARARGDKQKAQAAFAAAREKIEAQLHDKPKDVFSLADIAKLDAALGRKEEAIREARRAVDLEPITRDALHWPDLVANLVLVYAWTGERDRALEQLEKVATLPGYAATYGDLLLNPCWDDLRGDPRFDKIVSAAKAASR